MKQIDFIQQEQVINSAYISPSELMKLVPIGINQARKIMKEVITDMELEHLPVFNYHQLYAPTERVLKKIGMSAEHIRSQAESIRRGTANEKV